jgi:hypothetical protein
MGNVLLTFVTISLVTCTEKKTNDPIETYKLWAGEVPKDVQVVNGKYWQSSHWTKEYIMYLELKTSPLWINEFNGQNNLVESKEQTDIPPDAPVWFKPTKRFKSLRQSEPSQGSVYFEDMISGTMYIYEIQL